MQAFGRLDILVNNAGIYEFVPLESVTEEHFHKHFNLNVLGPHPHLASSGEAVRFRRWKHHQHQLAWSARLAFPNAAVYSGTKAAVDAITRSLAKELGPRGIRVNAINPGMVETEGTHCGGHRGGRHASQVEAQTPLGRTGQPQDIASAAVFLASADASWITGETFVISGGFR